MHNTFVKWIKMLLVNVNASVIVNGNIGKECKIERGVRQGWPLALYFILIVGKILNRIVYKNDERGKVARNQIGRWPTTMYLTICG